MKAWVSLHTTFRQTIDGGVKFGCPGRDTAQYGNGEMRQEFHVTGTTELVMPKLIAGPRKNAYIMLEGVKVACHRLQCRFRIGVHVLSF